MGRSNKNAKTFKIINLSSISKHTDEHVLQNSSLELNGSFDFIDPLILGCVLLRSQIWSAYWCKAPNFILSFQKYKHAMGSDTVLSGELVTSIKWPLWNKLASVSIKSSHSAMFWWHWHHKPITISRGGHQFQKVFGH